MGKAFLKKTTSLLQAKRKRKRWQRTMISLSLVVAMVTSCLLIHPAITMERIAICGQEEHTHTKECYEHRLVCGKTEQSAVPATEEKVLNCSKAVHEHGEGCYDAEGQLVCTTEAHNHDDSCYQIIRTEGVEGHTHTDACYEDVLICGKQEHTHTEACYPKETEAATQAQTQAETTAAVTETQPAAPQTETVTEAAKTETATEKAETEKATEAEKPEARTLTVKNGEYTIQVDCPADAKIPKNAVLSVREIKKNDSDYNSTYERAASVVLMKTAKKIETVRFFDLSISVDGKEIQPKAAVNVKITFTKPIQSPEGSEVRAIRLGDDADVLATNTNKANGSWSQITFKAKKLTVYATSEIAVPVAETAVTEAETSEVMMLEEQTEETETEATTEAVTEEVTEAATEEATEAATEEATEAVTEEVTEAVTEESTEEPDTEEMTEEDPATPHILTTEGSDYTVEVTYTAEAGIPEGAELQVREIAQGTAEYESYYQQAMAAVQEGDTTSISFARFFDISFVYEGEEIEPSAPVAVKITYADAVEVPEAGEVKSVHFGDEAEVLNVQTNEKNGAMDEVTFDAESFSVYGIVGTETITVDYLTADGSTYQISIDISNTTNIPSDAEIDIRELNGDEYNQYIGKAAAALDTDADSIVNARLFDISIVKDGKDIQPNGTVNVEIKLMNEVFQDAQVVHFGEKTEILEATTEGNTVAFETSGFSIYAIVDKEDDLSVARAKIVFQNVDGSEFTFLNNSGNTVNNQIIHSGSVLEEVGIPSIDVNGQTFQGWYIYDTTKNAYTSYQLKFGGSNTWTINYGDTKSITSNTAVVTSEDVDDSGCIFYARPYFGKVSYLTFYNESAGDNTSLGGHGIILNRVQVIEGTEYDISTQQATPPDSIWDEETRSWKPVSYVFVGWSNTAGSDDDNRTALSNTTITVSDDQSFYPIFKQGHWVTYDSAPTGSGATYLPAKIVLSTQTTSVARPTVTPTWKGHSFVGWFTTPEDYDPENENYYNTDGTINTTYNGFFSTNETAVGAYAFNESLDEDLTLYAHWNVDTANVTVIKWQQVVTDDKNATTPTKEQMAAEDYASNTGLKHYEYAGQQNLDEIVNSILQSNDDDIIVPTGFDLNSTLSDAQVVVKDDGTAVLNLYYDRQTVTMNFDKDIDTYTETTDTSDTQYGLVNGEYVELTWNGTNWVYTTTEQVTEYVDYTGDRYNTTNDYGNDPQKYGVYKGYVVQIYYHTTSWGSGHWSRKKDHITWGDDQQYRGTCYVKDDNGTYGFVNGAMVQLTNGQYQTTTTKTTEHIYEGTHYARGTTRSFTGLYGQTLAQNGYTWPSGMWRAQNNAGSSMGFSFLTEFIPPEGFSNVLNFTSGSASETRHVYVYFQNVDGSYTLPATIDSKLSSDSATWYPNEEFVGFTVDSYQVGKNSDANHGQDPNKGTWNQTSVNGEIDLTLGNPYNNSPNTSLGLKYRRLKYTIKFLDSHDGSILPEVPSQQVVYGGSLSDVEPDEGIEVTNTNTQYVWDGKWYADQACTTEFDFTQTMPSHDVAVYAGWNEVWYWVKIDPNGGELPSTESTWFWESYGGIVEEYYNITRGFVEDTSGEYYYHVDVLNPETGLNQYGTNDRRAEYRLISENPNWEQDSVDGKRYSSDTANTYSLVGWYKVNDDGTLEPYNFSSPVTDNLTLRALWRIVGEYHIRYSVEGVDAEGNPLYVKDADGQPTTKPLLGTNAPSDTNKYADKSSSSILAAANPPSGYTFVGWYYNGHVYNPGDTFIVDADLADENRDVWIYPVYLSIEDQPVETTHIPFVGNGGTTTKTDGSDETWTWEVTDEQTRINYVDVQTNMSFSLAESPTYFTRYGYDFVGWGKRTEGDTTTANNFLEYRDGKFYLVGTDTETSSIAADEFQPNEELYALWKAKTYSVTVVKEVSSPIIGDDENPFVFTPSFTGMSGIEYQTNFSLVGKVGGSSVTTIDEGGNEFTVTYDHSKTFGEIPYGTTFSFREGSYDEFNVTVTYSVTDADDTTKNVSNEVSSNGATLTVDGNITVTFTNTRKTTSINLKKVAKGDTTPLPGAAFTLLRKNNNGSYAVDGSIDAIATGVVHSLTNGTLTIEGLPSGDYRLTETKSPDGYIILTKDIYFTVNASGNINVISPTNGQEAFDSADIGASTEGTNNDTLVIPNTPGQALPMTGGSGTLPYTLSGLLLMCAAAMMYGFRMRRRERRLY